MAVITPKQLGQGQAGAVNTTLYTVPAATTAIIRNITACNSDLTASHSISVFLVPSGGAAGDTTVTLKSISLDPSQTAEDDGVHILGTGGTVVVVADVAAKVTVTIDGAESV